MAEYQLQNQDTGAPTSEGVTSIQSNLSSKRLCTVDDVGFVNVLGTGIASTVENSSALNTTETVLIASLAPVIQVGSVFRITITGTNTSTVANASTFTGRFGSRGTTADSSFFTAAVTSAASGTNVPFKIVIEFTVRTIGASGTIVGMATVFNQGTTGLSTLAVNVIPLTVSAFDTSQLYVSVSYLSAAVTTTSTFSQSIIEQVR